MRESNEGPDKHRKDNQCCFDNLAIIGDSPRGIYYFIRKNRLAIIRLVLNCQFYGELGGGYRMRVHELFQIRRARAKSGDGQ